MRIYAFVIFVFLACPLLSQITIDGFFEDGIPVGVWAWRDEKGNIIKKETFKRKEKGFLRDMKEYVDKEMIK